MGREIICSSFKMLSQELFIHSFLTESLLIYRWTTWFRFCIEIKPKSVHQGVNFGASVCKSKELLSRGKSRHQVRPTTYKKISGTPTNMVDPSLSLDIKVQRVADSLH